MKPFVIGFVLAVVLLAAGFLVPTVLRPAEGKTALAALREAELARRQLGAYDVSLPLVGTRTEMEQLKEADFDQLLDRSQEAFEELGQEFSTHVRKTEASDRESGVPASDLRPVSATAAGIRSAVGRFESALRENKSLLSSAAQASRSASQSDRDALNVSHVAGIVRLVEAAGALAEARGLREQLTVERAHAFAVATRWATTRDAMQHYAGLDVTGVRKELEGDTDEIKAALASTRTAVDELTAAVAERERALATVRAELEEARGQRLSMEEMGFTVGDDASFEAYREQYLKLSRRLRALQDREHLLDAGGVEGGQIGGDDLMEAPIEGGERIVGLDELKRRLAIAQDKLERYARAEQALGDQDSLLDLVSNEARTQEQQHQARLDALTTDLEQVLERLGEMAQQAYEREEAALGAARTATSAFRDAASAVRAWTSEAQQLQQAKDPQRLNARLKRIVGDDLAGEFPTLAEAQSRVLLGRIHTERYLGLAAYLDTLTRISELRPGGELDVADLQERAKTAREEAITELSKARETYEPLAQRETNTSWVHRASLAAVSHLLWQIDELNADQHRSDSIEQLGKAVERRRQSPYLHTQVALYDVLTGGMAPPPPPEPVEPEPEPEAEETVEEG